MLKYAFLILLIILIMVVMLIVSVGAMIAGKNWGYGLFWGTMGAFICMVLARKALQSFVTEEQGNLQLLVDASGFAGISKLFGKKGACETCGGIKKEESKEEPKKEGAHEEELSKLLHELMENIDKGPQKLVDIDERLEKLHQKSMLEFKDIEDVVRNNNEKIKSALSKMSSEEKQKILEITDKIKHLAHNAKDNSKFLMEIFV